MNGTVLYEPKSIKVKVKMTVLGEITRLVENMTKEIERT